MKIVKYVIKSLICYLGFMPKSELLLFCPRGDCADEQIASLRRFGFGVHACTNFISATQVLETRPVIAIMILSNARSSEIDSLLAFRLQHHSMMPVLFLAVTEYPNIKRLLEHPGVLFLPKPPPPSEVERLLISVGAYTTPPWLRYRKGIPKNLLVTIRAQEYPVRYEKARFQFEKEYFEMVLRVFHGNVSRASLAMGMGRRNLQMKIRKLKIDLPAIRNEFMTY
ncbi:hypothetical protein KKG66_12110 [bacterium]|nr:hypothetical protein [bacterium]MBU1921583.1 hypothetical protein [bacterium]